MRTETVPRLYTWLYALLFLAAGYGLLLGRMEDYLVETAWLTPFFTTADFARDLLGRPCGLLFYVASALQSCLAWPWLGASLLLAVSAGTAFALRSVCRVRGPWEALCWLPSLASVAGYVQDGWLIYLFKTPAVAFSMPLGLLGAALLFRLWSSGRAHGAFRAAMGLAVALCGWWLTGVYALLACAMFVVGGILPSGQGRRTFGRVFSVAAPVCGLAVPGAFCALGWIRMPLSEAYTLGLPDYAWQDGEWRCWLPWAVAAVMLLLLPALRFRPWGRLPFLLGPLVFAGGMAASGCRVYDFANFRSVLAMKRAAWQGDWAAVAREAAACKGEPTRFQVALGRLALFRLGRAGDGWFRLPDGDAECVCPRPYPFLRVVAGPLLYWQFGRPNFSYRWCMEHMVEYGERPEYLALMLKCSLANGERRVARKYLEALRDTWFFRSWAERYAPYVEGLRCVDEDEEMRRVRDLVRYDDLLDGDNGAIEAYILRSFALTTGGTRDIMELSLLSRLVMKELDGFWPRFAALLPLYGGRVPVHLQEAALMVRQLQGGPDLGGAGISPEVAARFNRLLRVAGRYGDAARGGWLKGEFGGTYWYYYFFVNGLQTK